MDYKNDTCMPRALPAAIPRALTAPMRPCLSEAMRGNSNYLMRPALLLTALLGDTLRKRRERGGAYMLFTRELQDSLRELLGEWGILESEVRYIAKLGRPLRFYHVLCIATDICSAVLCRLADRSFSFLGENYVLVCPRGGEGLMLYRTEGMALRIKKAACLEFLREEDLCAYLAGKTTPDAVLGDALISDIYSTAERGSNGVELSEIAMLATSYAEFIPPDIMCTELARFARLLLVCGSVSHIAGTLQVLREVIPEAEERAAEFERVFGAEIARSERNVHAAIREAIELNKTAQLRFDYGYAVVKALTGILRSNLHTHYTATARRCAC